MRSPAARLASFVLCALLAGCAGMVERIVDAQVEKYFETVPAPAEPLRHRLDRLPFSGYWTGIVFNGEKIGFARLELAPAGPERWELRSEASFALRFLGFEKRASLRARDTVGPDLSLERFAYEYVLDGSAMKVSGRREDGVLALTVTTGGTPVEKRLPAEGPVLPSSAILLHPVLHGLAPGREYRYRVFSGELQALHEVVQRVEALQTSRLFRGEAYKVETRMAGQRTLAWLDRLGRPVFELAMQGVMISALEDEEKAKRYLAAAALNKKESLVEFSRVPADRTIARPREVRALRVALEGAKALPPADEWQRCQAKADAMVCEIRPLPAAAPARPDARHLGPSITVQSRDPEIARLAAEIAGDAASAGERIARIVRWMDANIEKAPLDVFSARDVLERRRAECQGHAWLYAALARASGIPTRIVNGLVYSGELEGFLYHSWAESLVEGAWQAVDPTFGQAHADATHIKLFEGETLADLLPLVELVGRLRVRVLEVVHP